MHPDDNDAAPSPGVRRRDSLTPDGEVHLNWAYDTPLAAPRRGLEARQTPSPAPESHTISPLLARRRTEADPTPRPAALPPEPGHGVERLDALATAVLLLGLSALALAGLAAIATGLLLLL